MAHAMSEMGQVTALLPRVRSVPLSDIGLPPIETKKTPAQGEEKSAGARFWDRRATNLNACAHSLHAEIITPRSG